MMTFNTLEFNLASGLGELELLRNLKKLYICQSNHRTKEADLNWITDHWHVGNLGKDPCLYNVHKGKRVT